MQRAKAVQLGMLPEPPVIPGLDIHVHYQACEDIGGDFYDFINVSPNELGIVVADVSGHGLDAALLMAAAKKSLQIHARGRSSPRETLTTVCRDLVTDLPRSSFITVFYGILNLRDGVMRFASAGHNPPVVLSAEGIRPVPSRGMVISATLAHMLEKSIDEQVIELKDGDSIVLHTDGVTESKAADSSEFGEVAFSETLKGLEGRPSAEVSRAIVAAAEEFNAADAQEDDITLLVFRCESLEILRSHRTPVPQDSRWPTNLGVATQRLIGREELLANMASALATQPAVSVVGPGGIGKTALISELGRRALQGYAGGAWWFDCNGVASFDEVIATVTQTLGIAMRRDAPLLDSLVDAMRYRPPTLLLLDGVDGITDLAPAVERLVRECADLRFVLAGHSDPGISGVRKMLVPGLPWPGKRSKQSHEELSKLPSVELFLERARESDASHEITDEEFNEIAGICNELEGLPLAIELAAAAVDVLPLKRIHHALRTHSHKIDALEGAGVNTAALRKTVEWTYGLLSEDERQAVRALSIFHGGFSIEAAESVLSGVASSPVDLVSALRRKGIIRKEATPYGARFHLGAALRSLGRTDWEMHAGVEDDSRLLNAYVEYYTQFANEMLRLFKKQTRIREGTEAAERTALELENLRHAFERAVNAGSPEAVTPLALTLSAFAAKLGPVQDRRVALEKALTVVDAETPFLRAKLLSPLATEEFEAGNLTECITRINEALELEAAAEGDDFLLGLHSRRAHARAYLGELDEALKDIREEERRCLASGKEGEFALPDLYLYAAHLLEYYRRFDEALIYLDQADEQYEKVDLPGGRIRTLSCRGAIATKQRHHDEAVKAHIEAAELARVHEQGRLYANELNSLGLAFMRAGRFEEALTKLNEGEALHREVAHHLGLVANWSNLAELGLYMDKLDLCAEFTRRTEEEAMRVNFLPVTAKARLLKGCMQLVQGKLGDAVATLSEAAETYEQCGDHTRAAIARLGGALALWQDGRGEESNEQVRAVRQKLKDEDNPSGNAMFLLGVCRALSGRGIVREDQQEVLDERAQRLAGRYGGDDRERTFATFLALRALRELP